LAERTHRVTDFPSFLEPRRTAEKALTAVIQEAYVHRDVEELGMRTTVTLDDKLLERARALSGIKETSSVLREALKALVERESARRVARLGGSEPALSETLRRRFRDE
jgi:hypothetical protein